jgi:hypothetical protein
VVQLGLCESGGIRTTSWVGVDDVNLLEASFPGNAGGRVDVEGSPVSTDVELALDIEVMLGTEGWRG